MKKILAITLLMLSAILTEAQVPGFNIGPKIGYNTRKLPTDKSDIKSSADGAIQFGLFARIGKKLYLQPEVNYVVKGGTIYKNGSTNVKIKLNSITVPLLVGYKLVDFKAFNIRLMGGPTASFIINKNVPVGQLQSNFPVKSKNDIKDAIWSLQVGGGVDVLNVTVDVRYEIGINNIYQGTEDFKMRNNLLNISAGWKFL